MGYEFSLAHYKLKLLQKFLCGNQFVLLLMSLKWKRYTNNLNTLLAFDNGVYSSIQTMGFILNWFLGTYCVTVGGGDICFISFLVL